MPNLGEEQRDAYSMPQTAPLYPAGPYEYREFTALLLQFPVDARDVRPLVPDPLAVLAEPRCLVGVYDYGLTDGLGAYQELLAGLPVTYDGDVYMYWPFFVLNSDAAIAAGREVWGIPKKRGDVTLDVGGQLPTARVERGGVELLTASMDPTGYTADHPLDHSELRNVQWKRIPSASAGEPPVVDRLVVNRTRDIEVNWALAGDGAVEMSRSAADPVDLLAPAGDVTAYLLEAGWTLDSVDDAVLHRYEEAR